MDAFRSAVDLAAAIRRREVSPVEVADAYHARIDALDPRYNAFCHRADDDVRRAARRAADRVLTDDALPPFHGVPLPIKDLVRVEGRPTTYGSAGAATEPATASEPIVRRFTDAGFLLLVTNEAVGGEGFATGGVVTRTVDPACLVAVQSTLRTPEDAGNHLVDAVLPLPPADELISAFTTVWNIGAAGVPLADPERIDPHNRALRDAALGVDSWAYARAVLRAQAFSRRIVEGFLAGFDLLVTPTMACLPPPVGFWQGSDPLLASYPMVLFTSLFNVTGRPAISVPVHHDAATGLPLELRP